jgi:hypothetical protein
MINPRTITRRFAPITAVLLATIACGPPGFEGGSTSDDETTETDADISTSTSTTTDTETDETSTSFTTDGPDFVPYADLESPAQCDPFQQDCPDGEKCVPYGVGNWDANKCVPIMGSQTTGEQCTSGGILEATDDCDGTGFCWDVMEVEGEALGTCYSFCTGTADDPECPPSSECAISSSGAINLCIPQCDPLLQDCGEGLGCYWDHNGFVCANAAQNIPAGEPCEFINDCEIGLMCVPAEALPPCGGGACCSPFCELELGDGPCNAAFPGTVCASFYEEDMAPPGYEHVGICILPA